MAGEAEDRLLLLARIGAPHGVRGEVRVKSFTASPDALADYSPLIDESGRLYTVERWRSAGQMLVVKFEGVDDRDAAARLTNRDLFVRRDRLPPEEDEETWYHADLIGLDAVSSDGEALGTVIAVHDFGAGDLLEIAPRRGATLLVPFTKALVPEIDLAGRRLIAIPPADMPDEGEPKAEEESP
jgi:16S rRNA processing protein RimM